jgi:hypothetical protein
MKCNYAGRARILWLVVSFVVLTSWTTTHSVLAADSPAIKPSSVTAANQDAKAQPASTTPAANQAANDEKPRPAHVLFITAKNSPDCDKVLGKLMRPNGDFDKLRSVGWKIGKKKTDDIQIIDKDDVPDLVAQLNKPEYPTVAGIDKIDGSVVRYFRFGCTTPLDMWTFAFISKGVNERPKGFVMEAAKVDWTGHYPLRGNHWSVEGNWNPTKDETVAHLHGPNHQSQLIPEWHIEDWSLEELRSLHDDLHEKYDIGGGSSSEPSNSGSGGGGDYLRFKGKG